MKNRSCPTGLDGRCRDEDGKIRAKNGATKISTLRDIYGDDFAPGIRGDAKLDTLLERTGAGSLTDLVRKKRS